MVWKKKQKCWPQSYIYANTSFLYVKSPFWCFSWYSSVYCVFWVRGALDIIVLLIHSFIDKQQVFVYLIVHTQKYKILTSSTTLLILTLIITITITWLLKHSILQFQLLFYFFIILNSLYKLLCVTKSKPTFLCIHFLAWLMIILVQYFCTEHSEFKYNCVGIRMTVNLFFFYFLCCNRTNWMQILF